MDKEEKPKRKAAPLIVLALFLLIAGIAAILTPVLMVETEIRLDAEEYEDLRALSITTPADEPPQSGTHEGAESATLPVTADYPQAVPSTIPVSGKTGVDLAACQAENEDFVAWLQIPGTTVDYPVVLSNDTEHYLNYTFTGKKSYLGTLFSLENADYRTPGRNIAVYGHHIRSNKEVMFSPLTAYKKQGFYEGHETIYLDSLYRSDTYIIFAVINMRSGDWDPSQASFADDDDFLRFVHRAKSLSLYDTGVDVTATDSILTLITCDRDFYPKYGRLVVMAKKQGE